jgi:Fuc2NAc and GlcNAc transferase
LVVAALGTGLVRRYALARSLMDVPNARSSHTVPTPRGGGLAIAVAATLGFSLLAMFGVLDLRSFMALLGGIAVAIVGFLDDGRQVSVKVRLSVHLLSALWALSWLGGLPPLQIGEQLIDPGYAGYALGAVGIVWALNLFNFMDGVDGIAASEAVFVAVAAAWILTGDKESAWSSASVVFGAACGGFLLWNWPPARIFMGDVGSGYLGFVIAVLAIMATRDNPVALFVWLIAGAVFFVDATVTLVRRFVRGERVYEAHRSHAYQWLSRRWGTHLRVVLAVLLVNVGWLLPCAWVAARHPSIAAWMVLVALGPVLIAAVMAGAGLKEVRASAD